MEKLGGKVKEHADHLVITGRDSLEGGAVDGYNDHRIVMALAVAACASGLPALLTGAEAVNKSWPAFWDTLRALGAKVEFD